ncbi:sulfotransferase domain-containing protein [Taklimakanibacter deserti]|uniref:sulfotransferase domain-containing protein n=1 Tax=Taklimakanibacter deserti TaxID=2267839 RepID=UPI0013C485C0
MASTPALPREKSLKLERYLRGQEESRMLRQSDVVIVSFGKSGRTWLRVLLSRYFQLHYKVKSNRLLAHDNMHVLNRAIPRVFFTHDNYLEDFTGTHRSKEPYANSRVVLLVRHPADTAVSQFFQWKHRMRGRKKFINAYPDANGELSPFAFLRDDTSGIPKVVRFMNLWASELDSVKDIMVVRYETLRQDTAGTFGRILRFIGEAPKPEEIAQSVEFASIENMRALEAGTFYKRTGNRMKPGDAANPESYKVRRAKVGGYRDYFTDDQNAEIERLVATTLSPAFGYNGTGTDPRVI